MTKVSSEYKGLCNKGLSPVLFSSLFWRSHLETVLELQKSPKFKKGSFKKVNEIKGKMGVANLLEPGLRLAHFTYGKRRHYTLSTLPE